MSNSIIYTSIFGGYDNVNPQKIEGWDWKCFSEENSLPIYQDNTRNARDLRFYHIGISKTMSIVFLLMVICM